VNTETLPTRPSPLRVQSQSYAGPVLDVLRTLLGDHQERDAGIDPREYLADVLPRLTGRIRLVDLPSFLPSRSAAQRAASAAAAAQGSRMPIHVRRTHV
jgi:hypothetical protein